MNSDPNERADALAAFGRLLRQHRWAALCTLGIRTPEVSWVAYAAANELGEGLILHLSRLAAHTRNLERSPRASLGVSQHEAPDSDPQCLTRLALSGNVSIVAPGSEDHVSAACRYQLRLPDSVPLFEFADFRLFRFTPTTGRFVAGFAKAYTFRGAELNGA